MSEDEITMNTEKKQKTKKNYKKNKKKEHHGCMRIITFCVISGTG